jgi:hypothetical protein
VAHVSICNRPALYSDNSIILLILLLIHHSPYIVDSRSDPISVGCTIFRVARRYFRVFFPMALVRPRSQNGERAGPLAKMLLGAKHGGRPRIMSRIIVEEYFAL